MTEVLTEKRKRFADEWLKDCNETRAYKAAYPNVKKDSVAAAAGSRLLKNVKVKAYIDKRLAEIRSENTADIQEVMEYLTSVMRGVSMSEVVVVEGAGEGVSSARRMEKRPDERDRLKAAELLGKRFGMFTDKLDLAGEAAVVIVNDIPGGDSGAEA